MNIIILAAGYGTRMYPLTENLAKPLLPIKGKPVIEYLTDQFNGFCPNVVINKKFENQFRVWEKSLGYSVNLVVNESTCPTNSLGMMSDLRLAIKPNEDTLILGGDNFFPKEDLTKFLGKKSHSYIGIYDLPDKSLASLYGVVKIQGDSICTFTEKPDLPDSSLVSTLLYHIRKEDLSYLYHEGHLVENLVNSGNLGYIKVSSWHDIGDLKTYYSLK